VKMWLFQASSDCGSFQATKGEIRFIIDVRASHIRRATLSA
jgi:hypothetical protein